MVSVAKAKVEGRRRRWTGADGCPWDPFGATDEPSGSSPSQAAIRRTMIVFNHQFGKFLHTCCVDSQTSVTRQASHQRKESLLTEIDVNAYKVQQQPAVHDCHGRRSPQKNSLLSIISYEKASQVFEEKELDKHTAVRGCQAGGSGEGEWSRRVTLHEACMGVQVHTGTRICWDAHQTFFCMKVRGRGGGGGGPGKFFGNTDLKKNFENYGRPLSEFFFLTLDSTCFTISSHFGRKFFTIENYC